MPAQIFRFLQRWRDRRAVKRWIKSRGVDPVKLFTSEDERELVQILALLATEATPALVKEVEGDSAAAESGDDEKWPGSNPLEPDERYWYWDDSDYAREVGVKRWGPI